MRRIARYGGGYFEEEEIPTSAELAEDHDHDHLYRAAINAAAHVLTKGDPVYANLKVHVSIASLSPDPIVVAAWSIEHDDGFLSINLDGNDGTGSHSEPVGTMTIEPHQLLGVEANF